MGRAFPLPQGGQKTAPKKKKEKGGPSTESTAAYDCALQSARVQVQSQAYHGRAEARLARGRPEDLAGAVQDYTVALALLPAPAMKEAPRPAWLAQRGWLYLDALAAPLPALADFEKVLELRPDDGAGHT